MSIVKVSRVVIICSWLAVILWIMLIFMFSVQTADQSAGLSKQVTKIIVKLLAQVGTIDTDVKSMDNMVKQLHNIIRKMAHVGLYFVLGVLVLNGFIKTGEKGIKACAYALIFCLLYAVTDEVHQTFSAGRSGQVTDVLIDTTGAVIGIGMGWICKKTKTLL